MESGAAGGEASEIAVGMIEALPPVSAEAMAVPFLAARRWLAGQPEPESFDVEGAERRDEEEDEPISIAASRPALLWLSDRSKVIMPGELRPGQTIVVPASYGGIAFGNWAPAAQDPVPDVAELAAVRQRPRAVVRLHRTVVPAVFGTPPPVPSPDSPEAATTSDREIVAEWLAGLDPALDADGWGDLVTRLRVDGKRIRVERMPEGAGGEAGEYFVVTGTRRSGGGTVGSTDDRTTADAARSSLTGVAVTLGAHLDGVADMAAEFGRRLGLPDDLVADLRLAGEWHDAGKADPRFQRWLHGGSEFKALVQNEPLAKSAVRLASRRAISRARERAGYPEKTRHELMSVALMEAAGEPLMARARDRSLFAHLVASHHGHCRPFAPWAADPSPADVAFRRDGIESGKSSAHELARLDSGIADRFWQVVRWYGWWGAAYLEALLRLADHRQSEAEQDAKEARRA